MLSRKRKKEIKLELQKEEQRQKEMQAKMSIKRTLAGMKNQSRKLETFKTDYISKARKALEVGDAMSYKLAKSGLKLCLSKQRYLDSMIGNFEISLQINDMNKIIGEFVNGINIISDQMKQITSNLDLSNAQAAYDKALSNNETQYQALDEFLNTAAESIQTFDDLDATINDDELDRLILDKAADAETVKDREIDEKIAKIREKINE